jgi:MinD-like ATPase involved in chromosome partitioning or flagellar assembly
MIFTFYSYKGGVGRSMAMVNIAQLMSNNGVDVLMVDWDLEAPGLERFFFEAPEDLKQVQQTPGVIDLLLDYKEAALKFKPQDGKSFFPPYSISNYIVTNINGSQTGSGRLQLITSGRKPDDGFIEYSTKVKTFDWKDFYENWEGEIFFEWLREELDSLADVVLIDSRTGVTEMGGICTYQMGDTIVLFCAANDQNIDGTLRMLKSFSNPQLPDLRHGRKLKTIVIPSRIERVAETTILNRFRQKFTSTFLPYVPTELQNESDFFIRHEIPYIPLYAFEEKIAVNQKYSLERNIDLEEAYTKILQSLTKVAQSDSKLSLKVNKIFDQSTSELNTTSIISSQIAPPILKAQSIGGKINLPSELFLQARDILLRVPHLSGGQESLRISLQAANLDKYIPYLPENNTSYNRIIATIDFLLQITSADGEPALVQWLRYIEKNLTGTELGQALKSLIEAIETSLRNIEVIGEIIDFPVAIMAMTRAEAEQLFSGEIFHDPGVAPIAQQQFLEFRRALEGQGITNLLATYGDTREQWNPQKSNTSNIADIVSEIVNYANRQSQELQGSSTSIRPNFLSAELFSLDREQRYRAQEQLSHAGGLLIGDSVSLFHPILSSLYMRTEISSDPSVAVVIMSPILLQENSVNLLIEKNIQTNHERLLRRYKRLDQYVNLAVDDMHHLRKWLYSTVPDIIRSTRGPKPNRAVLKSFRESDTPMGIRKLFSA